MGRQRMNPTTLLTGSSGFIGTGIRSALLNAGHSTRVLVRAPSVGAQNPPALVTFQGDITDETGLLPALNGVSTIVHAASYIGENPEMQRRVNVDGTRKLVKAADHQQVQRLLYVSTFGVYGGNYAAGAAEAQIDPLPRSSLSWSRREAELIVLAHGGTVIRPALVYGRGDRWVIPPLVTAVLAHAVWFNEGQQLVSAIDRDTLGKLIVALIGAPQHEGVFHAARPAPVPIRSLVQPVIEQLGRSIPTRSVTTSQAKRMLEAAGLDRSKIEMISQDSWIDSSKIWGVTGLREPNPLVIYQPADVDDYASLLVGSAETPVR